MTTDKARKRAVRSRMTKTGERYAAARRHVVNEASLAPVAPPTTAVAPPADPGWSDETIVKGTGRDWAHWLDLLDAWGAMERTHTEIARWLRETQDITGWWAQTVTVGYERARGRRAVHQTTRGFEVSVSKTIRVPLRVVWTAVTDPAGRDAWMEHGTLEPTTARDGVVARFAVAGARAVVELTFDTKADDRTTVTATVRKLENAEDVERQRLAWREHLRRLDAAATSRPSVAADRSRAS